eukprot:g2012.t1
MNERWYSLTVHSIADQDSFNLQDLRLAKMIKAKALQNIESVDSVVNLFSQMQVTGCEQTIRDVGVDGATFLLLSENDLSEELGIKSGIQRKKILAKIEEIKTREDGNEVDWDKILSSGPVVEEKRGPAQAPLGWFDHEVVDEYCRLLAALQVRHE